MLLSNFCHSNQFMDSMTNTSLFQKYSCPVVQEKEWHFKEVG